MENIFYAISNPLWLSDTFICSKIKGYDKYCFVKVNVFNRIEEIGVDVEKRLHGAKIEEMTKYYVPVTKTHKMRFNSIDGEMWWELIHKSRYYDKSH